MKQTTSNVQRPTSNIQGPQLFRLPLSGRWLFAAMALTLPLALAADEWRLPDEKPAFKNAPGADIAQANCIMCHSHEYISTQPAFTRDQWKASVTKMQQKFGAPLAPEAVDALLDYLVQSYGKAAK